MTTKTTFLIASLAVALTLSLSMVQPAEASEYESTFNKSPTAYYTDDLPIPENQHLAVEGIASLLSVIDNTEDTTLKAEYQKHLEDTVVPYVAKYGVFLPGTEITSSMVPAADGHRGTIVVQKAFEVKAWIEYNCDPVKCVTQKVLKKLNFGELYSTNGVIGNWPVTGFGGEDLEFHHEIKNVNAASKYKIKVSNWGSFKDYSRGMTINCTTDSGSTPVVKYFAQMNKNQAYDIRYCDVDGIEYGDRINAAVQIDYYR